jgi:BirA family transcriptional regulator, biotin operon repressor / biotin---[acetyl-CoA-carboxylase] ligase
MAKLHAGMVSGGSCFLALHQSAGRGQRGKQWLAAPGENITMSTVFERPDGVSSNITAFPFVFSASVALGCYDFIKDLNVHDLSIKWPNDLYISDRKAAGILIENVYRGTSWSASIVGVGVNVNQSTFSESAPNAVSLSMITGKNYDPVHLGRALHQSLLRRYNQLNSINNASVIHEYNAHLYKRGQRVRLKKENVVFTATIQEVSESGELITSGALEQRFKSGEVEFV